MSGSKAVLRVHRGAAGVLIAAGIASCGGAGGGPPSRAATSSAIASAGGPETAAPSLGPGAPALNSTNPTPTAGTAASPLAPAVAVQMKALVPSAMTDDLHALGLDVKNLPPIEKLEPRTLRGVMKPMAKALGVKCGDCHEETDFAAPTRRKKIAARMWDEFAAKLRLADPGAADGALFCDSCHQGRVQLLDRRDKKALGQWMDDNFVARLAAKTAATGRSVECETCHVGMEMHFLAQWGQ